MGIIELIILSIGLAMDAFAVAICKGLSMKSMNWKKAIIIGLYFGFIDGKIYGQSEISKIIGMSQVQVSRKEQKVLQKLKQKMIV